MNDFFLWLISIALFFSGLSCALVGVLAAGEVAIDFRTRQGRPRDAFLAFSLLLSAVGLILGAAKVLPPLL